MIELLAEQVQWKLGLRFSWGSRNQWFEIIEINDRGMVGVQYKYDMPDDAPVWFIPSYNGYTHMFQSGYFDGHTIVIDTNKTRQTNYKRGKYAFRISPRPR